MVSRETYQYTSELEGSNTRLFKFEDGIGNDEIRCSLVHHGLDSGKAVPGSDGILECVPYSGLSYLWGGLSETQTIICDGKSPSVTRNLYSALQWLRN